jgi:hypothetical protein
MSTKNYVDQKCLPPSSSSSADPDQPKEKIEYLAEDNKYVRRMKNIENYCKLHYETDIGHDEVIDWVGTVSSHKMNFWRF